MTDQHQRMVACRSPYRVEAYNSAKLSENRIHDDKVAREYGFEGGLVPGVDVLAYMIHVPVAEWGLAFLERGLIEVRFIKPVYDGDLLQIYSTKAVKGLNLTVESNGLKASGYTALATAPPVFSFDDFPDIPPIQTRTPIDLTSHAIGKRLGTTPCSWAGNAGVKYRADIRELDQIYAREGLVHPGVLQRLMNRVLMENAILGPWIHVASRMQLLSAIADRHELTMRAVVTNNYEKNGHWFIEIDALIVTDGQALVAHCHHVAIYRPRRRAHEIDSLISQ